MFSVSTPHALLQVLKKNTPKTWKGDTQKATKWKTLFAAPALEI